MWNMFIFKRKHNPPYKEGKRSTTFLSVFYNLASRKPKNAQNNHIRYDTLHQLQLWSSSPIKKNNKKGSFYTFSTYPHSTFNTLLLFHTFHLPFSQTTTLTEQSQKSPLFQNPIFLEVSPTQTYKTKDFINYCKIESGFFFFFLRSASSIPTTDRRVPNSTRDAVQSPAEELHKRT